MRRLTALLLLVLAAVIVLRRRLARTPALEPATVKPLALLPAPRFLSVPWTLVAAPADSAELAIRADVAAPLALDRIDVQETPTQVFVTVLARPQGSGESGPTDTVVRLSHPLGERELIHAPADPQLYP